MATNSTHPSARGVLPILVALAVLAPGCVTAEKPHAPGEAATPCKVALPAGPRPTTVTGWWQNSVLHVPDPVHGGALHPGLAGCVYLFAEDLATTLHYPGRATIDLYDITPRPGAGPEPVFLQRTAFTPEVLKTLERTDPAGKVYKLYVPWQTYRPDISRVELRIAFQPEGNPLPLYADPMQVTLGSKVNDVIVQNSVPGQPTTSNKPK